MRFYFELAEWALSAILLQDALYACLKPDEKLELIFSHDELQSIAEKQLDKVVNTFHAERATTEDVYETLKANIERVIDSNGNTKLSEEAISKVKDDMVRFSKQYFKDIVWHSPVQSAKTGLSMGFNTHFPLSDLFISQETFDSFLQEVNKRDPSLSTTTSCLCEFYQRFSVNKFAPFYINTKGSNQNIGQCDFQTYNLIFEGER